MIVVAIKYLEFLIYSFKNKIQTVILHKEYLNCITIYLFKVYFKG